jgi:phasin
MAVRKPAAKASAKAPVAKPVVSAPAPVAASTPKPDGAPAAAPAKAETVAKVEKVAATEMVGVDVAAIQENIRTVAAKSLEQGRVTFDRLKAAADEAAHSIEHHVAASSKDATEIAGKALDTFKLNAHATFDHLKALAGARSIADAVALHGQFLRAQSETTLTQAKEIAELAKKAAMDAGVRLQEQVKKPLFP